jgi:amino acid transporter
MTDISPTPGRLGTFGGVFTPSLLTIVGMVLFLRLGFVVGSVGFYEALLILALAHAISILTSLSVAAIATNLRVKGGGDYYLISRTLGLGFGGAIGIVLFLAQSVAVGFYCIGFAEAAGSLLTGVDGGAWLPRALAGGAALALFGLAWLGTAGATRLQYGIMALLIAAIAAFAAGAYAQLDAAQLAANMTKPPEGLPFWGGFAVFFPAVTGFTQGISMSGDLRDPGRSIPMGTLSAVLLSMLVYFVAAALFAGAVPLPSLSTDGLAMKRLSLAPVLFDAGVIAATLSSALASFLGAPRILQAMAHDGVLPVLKPLTRGDGPGDNPRRALVVTAVIAMAVIMVGSLNAVAGIVSMFFLLSYGLLNYATYYEAKAASPSFRPSFRFFDRRASLVGAAGCLAVMLAIDPVSALVAGAVVFAVLQYVRLRAVPARWADSRRSYHLQQVREHLLGASTATKHPRDWRPQVLAFSDDPRRRARVLKFASWIEGGAGLVTVVQVLERQGAQALADRAEAIESLRAELAELGSTAFPLVVTAPKLDDAIPVVIQSAGVGPVSANTVIVNWLRDGSALRPFAAQRFSQNLRTAFRLGCNLLILDADAELWRTLESVAPKERRIDIWWADGVTAELMLLLAHLMTRSEDWEGASIRVLALPRNGQSPAEREHEIAERLDKVRISARTEVLTETGDGQVLLNASRDASIVFVPFSIHGGRFYGPSGNAARLMLEELPIAVLAMAAEDVDLEADPDEGAEGAESEAETASGPDAAAGDKPQPA